MKIAEGLSSEEAAISCGVSGPVGVRWFRERGGMPSIQLTPPSGRYLSFAEREDIALLRGQGLGVRAIARTLGRPPSTISRELRRNAATRGGRLDYRASIAQWKAELQARRPKTAKLASEDRLHEYVQDRLAGTITRPDGEQIPGPEVRFIGRRHGRRADRRWATSWSPEQISNRLKLDFPEDASMRISHEAIYQALFIQGRGALKRELVACLRTGRALRVPRARTKGRGKQFVTPEIMITERQAEVADRAVPGHWEGDLIIGLNKARAALPGHVANLGMSAGRDLKVYPFPGFTEASAEVVGILRGWRVVWHPLEGRTPDKDDRRASHPHRVRRVEVGP